MITLCEIAELYSISERTALNLAKKYKVAISQVDNTWMMDEVALAKVLAYDSRWGDKYLKEELHARKEELTDVLTQIDDLISLFKSVRKMSPLLRLVIDEMAAIIPHKQKKEVFMAVFAGKGISEVAQELQISFARASYMYNSSLRIIGSRLGFLKDYRNALIKKDWEIRKLQILNRNQGNYIQEIFTAQEKKELLGETEIDTGEMVGTNIPLKNVRLLSLNLLTDKKLETRVTNCLSTLEITTVEDLLRHVKRNGGNLQSLFTVRNFGTKSFHELMARLMSLGVMDAEGNSCLYQYIK